MIQAVKEREYLSLEEYRVIAIQTIKKFFPRCLYLLKNSEAIDYIIEHIMLGDWKHDNQRSCRKTHRCNSAKYAIRGFLLKQTRSLEKLKLLYEHIHAMGSLGYFVNNMDVIELLIDIDENNRLTNIEKECFLRTFFSGESIKDISEDLDKSRSFIALRNKNAIAKLQRTFGV